MMGPVTIGGKKRMTLLAPNALNNAARMTYIKPAHRTPKQAEEFAANAEANGFGTIIAAAGKAAHLAGVLAATTPLPVIGLPMKSSTMDGLDSLLSVVQMPKGVPVATVAINGAENAAILAVQILAAGDPALRQKIKDFKKKQEEEAAEQQRQAEAAQTAANNTSSSSGNTDSGSSGGNTTITVPDTPAATTDLVLFAAILQCEAGGYNYDGILAVATVIMNRVESPAYPNTISGVVYQSGQFAPTWDGSLSRVLQSGPVSLCYQVAQEALGGARLASVSGCYQFRSASTGMSGINVGGNVFF